MAKHALRSKHAQTKKPSESFSYKSIFIEENKKNAFTFIDQTYVNQINSFVACKQMELNRFFEQQTIQLPSFYQ